ncbi:MAG: BatD family protein [Bryobacterales bacterium]|nr:BatD family protein [Bryobacterales bacterium]
MVLPRTLAGLAVIPALVLAQDAELRARAAVRSQQVYLGQHFLLQVQIEGTDSPDPVDMRVLEKDFVVSEAGGGSSNSTSVSIVNGRMTQSVRRGYNLNYRLAARRPGQLQIPPLSISAGGQSATTQPVPLRVLPPQENSDFRLRLGLSESRAFVGQPVVLTVDWFIGRDIGEYGFSMPLLADTRFEVTDPPTPPARDPDELIGIQLGDRRAQGWTYQGELNGRPCTVLRFQKVLVARQAGSYELPSATVTFAAMQRGGQQRRGVFDDFFGMSLLDTFGGRRATETLAIPSNRPRLEVRSLPADGRPARFNGWIGQFELEASASPTAVEVGEPVTLTMTVRGAQLLPSVAFPALDIQPSMARDFKVPQEMGVGEIKGDVRTFTQTVRARHDAVSAIPPVELPYFEPRLGEYRTARSEPIPITVEPSRIVTAEDIEGGGSGGPRQLAVESAETGLGHSYTGADALRAPSGPWTYWLRPLGPPPLATALIAVPPLLWCAVMAVRVGRRAPGIFRLPARGPRARWRRAIAKLRTEAPLGEDGASALLYALREYLGALLEGSASIARAWTFGDVAARLEDQHGSRINVDALDALRSVFERCEASRYAGGVDMDASWLETLISDAEKAVARLEGALK